MRALFMYDVRWFFLLCCYFVVLVLCFFGCSQHAWSLIDCIFIVSVDWQMSCICSKINFMLVRLMRLYTSTQQEHHSPLFCTVADLQLMLHDSDLPCEAPGQPYFSSPVGFFKQWPPWLCRRRGAAGWPAHAEPANHAMSHRRLNHEPAPEKPSSPNALPQRGKQFLGTYPDRLDFSAATQVPWMWNASQCAWGPKGAWTQRPQSERLCGGVVLLHRIHHHEDLHMVAQALQSAMVILTRVFCIAESKPHKYTERSTKLLPQPNKSKAHSKRCNGRFEGTGSARAIGGLNSVQCYVLAKSK